MLRDALRGAEATLPPREPVPEQVASKFNGRSVIELRNELGKESFAQRQMSKTRGGDYTRAEMLERMILWMHASGAATYDARQHRAAEMRVRPQ